MTPNLNVTTILDPQGLVQLEEFFAKQAEANQFTVGWDIETTPLKDYFYRRARTFQFGTNERQIVVDLLGLCNNDPEELFATQGHYGTRLSTGLTDLLKITAPVIETNKWIKVGVNLGFEYMTLYWNFGRRTQGFYDCAMAERCIWAGVKGMKQYALFSMAEMMEQYFGLQLDKTEQTNFTLDGPLDENKINYAALDTRLPLGIKTVQGIIASGHTLAHLRSINSPAVRFFEHLEPKQPGTGEPVVMGDKLHEIIQIENDAIGAFEDMHIHGERMDKERWLARINKKKVRLNELFATVLDPIFIPFVGDKNLTNTDAEIEAAELKWKGYNTISAAELAIKGLQRRLPKDGAEWLGLEAQRTELESQRKIEKEYHKTIAGDMKKKRTKVKNLAAKCEGNALINYSSDAQLMAVLKEMKGLQNLKSMDDEALEKYEKYPVMKAIRELHGLQKEIGTYGDQWAQEWVTKPCKEEGWLHPGDGRLHCVFNQYDAETGRSSSEKPNGQNLPQDIEVRSCFIADPPDESIRISNCCDSETTFYSEKDGYECDKCLNQCTTHAEEYVIITADMSGAELRIIAELAQDSIWIGAFRRGEDVHSVGTEILHEDGWKNVALENCAYYKLHTEETIALNAFAKLGDAQRQKCKCPLHQELRNDNKSTNFLLAYGGGPGKLAKSIKKTVEKAKELMNLHSRKFPKIWAYLEKSGRAAKMLKKSFDMFGRRRIFPEPTWARAEEKYIDDNEKALRLDEADTQPKIALFVETLGRQPTEIELYELTHRKPTSKEIGGQLAGMTGGIERQGKNHSIQSANATIIKKSMGCGHNPDGTPYLWHLFPLYRAKLVKMVHDELVVQCPKQYGEAVARLIGEAFKKAAAEKMKHVQMEFEYHIGGFWSK